MFFYTPFKFGQIKDDTAPMINLNFEELENVINGHLTSRNIEAKGITADSLAFTPLCMVTGSYKGDGTADRIINLPIQPIYVEILATIDYNIFEAIGDITGKSIAKWYRASAGAFSGSNTDWQGICEDGIKTGSNTESVSNKTDQEYVYVALGYNK